MQVRPLSSAPLSFDRVDHPVEAMLAPTADVVSLQVADSMLRRAPGVEVQDTVTDAQGRRAEMRYRIEPTATGYTISGSAGDNPIQETVELVPMGNRARGRIGGSQDCMDTQMVMGGWYLAGQVGEVPVQEQVSFHPWASGLLVSARFGPSSLEMQMVPSPEGPMVLQGTFDGQPFEGRMSAGDSPDSVQVVREFAGYRWVQEIRALGAARR
ncbi:MAG TPA: hypothetical protein VNO81_02830 [Candidatus Nitrosotenuis sp.]|jgi:hypothetical protein|nr:hypothetical protein [Candidatus Nitrosotenuis sp.]